MRFYYDALVLSLLLPMAVGAACVVLAHFSDRLLAPFFGNALVALAAPIALLLAVFALGWLIYPPALTHDWLPYLGFGAALAYAVTSSLPSNIWWAWLVPLEVGAIACWLLLPDWTFPLYVNERPFWFLFFPQIVLLVWTTFQKVGERSEGAGPVLPMLLWAASVVILLILCANARFAQMACVVLAAHAGAALPAVSRAFRARWYHSCPAVGMLLSGLLLQGYLFSREWQEWSPYELPRVSFLLVFVAPLTAVLFETPGLNRVSPLPRRLMQGLIVALTAAVGIYLALALPELMPGDEWE